MVALEAFLWTLTAWMFTALCAYFVSFAFHLHLPFACGVLVVVAVGLSMILPSPPGAIGVFEGAALIALKAYGVPHSEALPYALVLHAVNFVPYLVVGALLLQYNARHPGPKRAFSLEASPEGAASGTGLSEGAGSSPSADAGEARSRRPARRGVPRRWR